MHIEAHANERRLRVLVIEDDDLVRRMMGRVLRSSVEPVLVASGEEALALIAAGDRFDAIFCDLHLQGISGEEFYWRLLTQCQEQAARVVIMSGAGPSPFDPFAQAIRGRWIQKPSDKSRLLDMIARVSTTAVKAITLRPPSRALNAS
jgi:CheY-like chemotaxis protein